jgi:hypothetical protein
MITGATATLGFDSYYDDEGYSYPTLVIKKVELSSRKGVMGNRVWKAVFGEHWYDFEYSMFNSIVPRSYRLFGNKNAAHKVMASFTEGSLGYTHEQEKVFINQLPNEIITPIDPLAVKQLLFSILRKEERYTNKLAIAAERTRVLQEREIEAGLRKVRADKMYQELFDQYGLGKKKGDT